MLVGPNSKKPCVKKHLGLFKFYLKSPATESKANVELISTIAKILKIPKSSINLVSGFSARSKTLSVDSDLSLSEIYLLFEKNLSE